VPRLRDALLVALGGGLGASLRYAVALALAAWSGAIPVDYLVINVVGSFAIGVVLALTVELERLSARGRVFWAVGVIGGFTTFSTFEAGVYDLLARHHLVSGLAYAVGSLLLGLTATFAGLVAARALWRVRPRQRIAQPESDEPAS
jgi:fluoride exporter